MHEYRELVKIGRLLENKVLEKKANFFLGLLPHYGGNAIMRGLNLDHANSAMNILPKSIIRGVVAPNKGMPTAWENFIHGLMRGAVPEYGSVLAHGSDLGMAIRKVLSEAGIEADKLTKGDIIALFKLAKGDVLDAYNLRTPHAKKLVQAVLGSWFPLSKKVFENVESVRDAVHKVPKFVVNNPGETVLNYGAKKINDERRRAQFIQKIYENKKTIGQDINNVIGQSQNITPEQLKNFLMYVGDSIKKNRVLGPLGRALNTKGTRVEAIKWATKGLEDTKKDILARYAGDAAANAVVGALDVPGAVISAAKRIADWNGSKDFRLRDVVDNKLTHDFDGISGKARDTIGNLADKVNKKVDFGKHLGNINENVSDALVGIPSEEAFKRGLEGEALNQTNTNMYTDMRKGGLRSWFTNWPVLRSYADAFKNNRFKGLFNRAKTDARDFAGSWVMSPFTGGIYDLQQEIGNAMYRAGINPENFAHSKEILKRHGAITEKEPTFVKKVYKKTKQGIDPNDLRNSGFTQF